MTREQFERSFEELHERYPYKVSGRLDTYSSYNEAWTDALAEAKDLFDKFLAAQQTPAALPDEEEVPDNMSFEWYIHATLVKFHPDLSFEKREELVRGMQSNLSTPTGEGEAVALWETLVNTESEKGWWEFTFIDGGVCMTKWSDDQHENDFEMSIAEWKDLINVIQRITKPQQP